MTEYSSQDIQSILCSESIFKELFHFIFFLVLLSSSTYNEKLLLQDYLTFFFFFFTMNV